MPETDFQNTPHFSRGGPAHASIGAVWLLLDLVLPVAVFFILLVCYRAVPVPVRTAVHPVLWATLAALLAGAFLWNRAHHAILTILRSNDVASLPFSPDSRYRVRVICWPDQAERLRTVTPSGFEPERFRAVLTDARILDITRPAQSAASGTGLSSLLVSIGVFSPLLGEAAAVVLLALIAYLLRLPTYARFSPGRLEIIRFGLAGTDPLYRQDFPLTGPVTISAKGFGHISWEDTDGKKRRLPLRLVLGRDDVAVAALAAALSRAQPPEPESL